MDIVIAIMVGAALVAAMVAVVAAIQARAAIARLALRHEELAVTAAHDRERHGATAIQQYATVTQQVSALAQQITVLAHHTAAVNALVERQERASREDAVQQRNDITTALNALRAEQELRLTALAEQVRAAGTQALDTAQARHEQLTLRLDTRLAELRGEHERRLEAIRVTVDEKLHGALEKRLGESFALVSKQLEAVHRGLGEMQALSSGVNHLNRVLGNVKIRGTWGEVQLKALLDQIMAPEQIEANASIRPRSPERVEFAIILPGREAGEIPVKLPIDAKFPIEDWLRLVEAAERADAPAVEAAGAALEARVVASAMDIRDRYIHPPYSTDFAILYLPVEGLYAEVIRRPGLAERLQSGFRVVLAGPTTLAALLNSLQMGFRTLAIQQRTAEVVRVLGAVKSEFAKHGMLMDTLKRKLEEAVGTVDKLQHRGRQMERKVRSVEALDPAAGAALLGLTDGEGTALTDASDGIDRDD